MRLKLYKINKNRLLLLPLAILLCFSCSLKQEIKQFFDIPLNSSVYTTKPTDSRVCTTANFVSVTDHISKTKPQGESKFIVNSSDLSYFFNVFSNEYYQERLLEIESVFKGDYSQSTNQVCIYGKKNKNKQDYL